MMNMKEAIIVAALLLIGAGAVFAAVKTKAGSGCDLPPMESLGFTNRSGFTITSIHLSQPGEDRWSPDLLGGTPLPNGEKRAIKLNRGLLPGASSFRIIYEDGREKIWPRLPLRNIFDITNGPGGKPSYDLIPVGS